MIPKFVYGLLLNLCFYNALSQMVDSTINVQTKYKVKDSVIVFAVSVLNEGCDSIGVFSNDPFYYCNKQQWPNCFFLQKEINGLYYYLYPDGTSPHAYSFEIKYLQKGQSCIFNIEIPIRKALSPIDSGSYSITFQIGYIKNGKETAFISETSYFKID